MSLGPKAMMAPKDQITSATAQIRSYGAVAVLGAGVPASRYPMTDQLVSLLWHSIDSDGAARSRLAADLGKPDAPTKLLIGDDRVAREAGWRIVETNHRVREAFQQAFARLDADREPTPAHYALARLVHAGLIEYVISFNWDTALERAYEQLFGASMTTKSNVLAKPHGDAARFQADWVLPHQPGVVGQGVLDRITELSRERPRVLLIIGYSGSDEAVVQQLLEPTQSIWPVIRVGPKVEGPETITGFADDVIPALADGLNAPVDMIGWRWVGFTRSRDLRAALLGYRLGPQDVRACPRLPAARTVARRLKQAKFAVIVGDSGAGKSITAFQAAYELNREGWAVVELSQPGVASLESVRTLESIRGPVVAVVDDAQALGSDVLQALERAAIDDHAVVIVATDRAPGQELVRVVATKAVALLGEYCADHRDVMEPLVREMDDRVGYGMGLEPFEWRVEAARTSDYAWQFMYVLSGGERRIGEALANLADEDEADLLFGVLAASQILSLDAGVSRDDLLRYAHLIGRDDLWLEAGLVALTSFRLVVSREVRFRTPHMRIAERGLLVLSRDPDYSWWRTLMAFLRSRLVDPAESLQGKLWLLRTINQSDPLRFGHRHLLLDEEVAWILVEDCLAAPCGRDRNIAAYLLWEIEWWHALTQTMADKVSAVLPKWILEATSEDVHGIRWLMGGLRSNFPQLHGVVSSRVAPGDFARRLEEYGTPDAGEAWGNLISELAHAHEVDTETWASRFQETLDADRVATWVRSAPGSASLRGSVELVQDLMGIAPRVAAVLVAAMTPALLSRLERDPSGAAHDLVSWAFSLFPVVGSYDAGLWQTGEYRALRDAVHAFVDKADWNAVGRNLTQAQLHEMDQIDLLTFSIHQFAPDAMARMTSSISLDDLDRITEGEWDDMEKIEHLVVSLGHGPDREPARSWVRRHRDEIQRMPTRIVPVAPEIAREVLARGGQIVLDVQGGLRWGWCAEALTALVGADRNSAIAVVESSRTEVLEGMLLRQANMVEGLGDFVRALDEVDPNLLVELLRDVDAEAARQHWSERLKGSDEETEAVHLLINRSLQSSGPIRVVAEILGEN